METRKSYSIEKLSNVSKVLKAISHPVKLQILQILGEHEPLDVTTICENIDGSCQISMMSQHLAKMRDNGVLKSEKIGKQVYYRINDRNILSIFDCIDKCHLI